jgi:nucleotide-binding universal stress UspA family protein
MKTDKILIVVDDSPSSVKAIQYGFNLARDLGAKVALLCVVDPSLALGNPDAGIFPDDALIDLKAKTDDFLNRMKNQYGGDVNIELMSPVGEIKATVIDIAVKWDAGLIVAGTHGKAGLSKLFKGSIANSIIHNSPIPVCVVPMGITS